MHCLTPTSQVCTNVVDDHQPAGQQEPDLSDKDVGDEGRGREEDQEADHMRPRILPKLVLVQAPFQAEHKRHKPCKVCAEWLKLGQQ